ncbi:MipA/OmpV family protein [Vibrio sp. SCSIO 43136]|uniref:MipA/OmpV family protein n=1 Tax=Vibrio sp. SCSIO 43136 TaxID=2819101 RepID=UPI002074EAB1|nr:MipA/OmpV family protein [Vibrio sp. SCSIO 43136]USD66814.1 MipA/OmpV family protein [Vibrio sp. SCSIO 43136]
MMKKSLLLLLLLSSTLQAQVITNRDESYGYAGAYAWFGQSTFSTNDTAIWRLVPTVYYEGREGFIDDTLVNYYVLPHFKLGVTGYWRPSEVGGIFASAPTGIDERKGNMDIGVTFGDQNVRATYLYDITSTHSGHEVQLYVSQPLDYVFRRFELTPYLQLDWRDKKLSGHLYNVSAQEAAASGLSQYSSDSTFTYKAGLIGRYDLSRKLIVVTKAQVEAHEYNSPLVQRDYGWSLEFAVTYQFAGY